MLTNVIPLTRTIRDHTHGNPTQAAVYTVAEVAELLTLSTTTAYQLVREGAIPARKLGGRWVIPKQRFHDWLNGLTSESVEPAVPATQDRAPVASPTGRRWA